MFCKVMHRDVEHIDGAYALREQSEVYDGNLASETEPLRLENRSFGTKMLELHRHSLGVPLTHRFHQVLHSEIITCVATIFLSLWLTPLDLAECRRSILAPAEAGET